MMKKKMMMMIIIMNNPDENAKIVKGPVVLRGRDLKFWERSEKNNISRKRNFRRDGWS